MKSDSQNKEKDRACGVEDQEQLDAQPAQDQEKAETVVALDELEACQKELAQWKDQATRIFADFDNYKKRIEREQAQWMQVAQTSVLKDIIDLVDDFDRALAQKTDDSKDLYAGIEMMYGSLLKMLEKYGVKEFSSYEIFDPELHEALMHVDSDTHESGAIVHVIQKGFMMQDMILRPAKVSVAK